MRKVLVSIFPVFDYLYIFQILEYRTGDFLKWWVKNFLKRDLQRKHQLIFTKKIIILAIIVNLLIIVRSLYAPIQLLGHFNILFSLILFVLLHQLSPIIIVTAQILILPIELYQKQKIINLAKQKRDKLKNLKVITITGSFGKTSTKNILYTLLWKNFRVVKTPKSYNNPLSIAQTILEDLKDNTEIFIVEVGAYKRGEIKKVTQFLKPQIGIITAVAPQHLEKFGSLENIALTKFEVVENLPKDGLAILNGESEHLKKLAPKSPCPTIFYAGAGNQIFATDIEVGEQGSSFLLHSPKGHSLITIPLIGLHHIQNFLPAAMVALSFGMSLNQIRQRAKRLQSTPHRLEIKKGTLTIIDNSYNTNPESSKTSFKLLSQYPGDQKIIITPGLIELGKDAEKENKQFIKNASRVADQIIIVGESFKKYLLKGLKEVEYPPKKIHTVKDLNEGMDLLNKIAKPNSLVLIENDLPDSYF